MDPLVLEIHTQGLHRYELIDKPHTRIGRAFDNDIILSEPTVAPYHLDIIRDDNGHIELHNLADVNPAQFNGYAKKSVTLSALPVNIKLGRIKARIVLPNHRVADTKTLPGNGQSRHLFSHAFWGVLLIALCLVASSVDFHIHSFTNYKWDTLAKIVARETALYLVGLIFFLAILERLIFNRSEIKPLVVVISLTYLMFQLISPLVAELNYFFTSDIPELIFDTTWYAILIPLITSLYLIHIYHQKRTNSVLLAMLLCSPLIILSAIEITQVLGYQDNFSDSANYHRDLSALNWQKDVTISIDSFIEQAQSLSPGVASD
ncbi:MAG: hypothetical protein ACI9CO_000315 [Candidatus Azotimanducaceae bacterium]|jgi:hypothetical protein